jgi:hypothetical protein
MGKKTQMVLSFIMLTDDRSAIYKVLEVTRNTYPEYDANGKEKGGQKRYQNQ